MAFDAFLKIDGIQGESTDDKHKDWMEITSCNWTVDQPTSASASTAGGGSAERANFHDFTITKELDKASPKLNLACADGTHIKEVILELCRSGSDKLKYMEYKLSDVIVSSVAVSGSKGIPTETVTLNYGKIEWIYTQQKRADGGGAGNIAAGWSLETNKKV